MKLRRESSSQASRRQDRHIEKEKWLQHKKKLGQNDVYFETLWEYEVDRDQVFGVVRP